jgi:hypothetical protein
MIVLALETSVKKPEEGMQSSSRMIPNFSCVKNQSHADRTDAAQPTF